MNRTERPPLGATDELHALMGELGRRRFLIHSFRPDEHGPDMLAATRDLGGCTDVLLLFDEQRACAYRTPAGPDIDVFAPRAVFWYYAASAVWTLRALLTLAPPGHPDAPHGLMQAPEGLGLPVDGRRPVRVRGR